MSASTSYLIDFKTLIDAIKDEENQFSCEKLSIWGGQCDGTELKAFLDAWELEKLQYRIWEYGGRIDFNRQEIPDDVDSIEWGRLFGSNGDLTLRRDSGVVYWNFIGKAEMQIPDTDSFREAGQNFWEYPGHEELNFIRNEEHSLLWGERHDGQDRWFADRVASALLYYPAEPAWERVQLDYWTFSRAGQVEFVWLRDISEWKEGTNG